MEFSTGTDPAGDVALGQDNSGAAAVLPQVTYQPMQIWQEAQKRLDAHQQKLEAQNLAIRNARLKGMEADQNFETKGALPIDVDREFKPAVDAYLKQYGELSAKGMHPEDPNDPSYGTIHQLRNGILQHIQASADHNALYNEGIKELRGANAEKYDQEASAAALTKWANLPLAERMRQPVPTLVHNFDLGKYTSGLAEDLKKTATKENVNESWDPKSGLSYTKTNEGVPDKAIGSKADLAMSQPEVIKSVNNQFNKEPSEIAQKYINYDLYRNSPDYKPAVIPGMADLPTLGKNWDNMLLMDKAKYSTSFPNYVKAIQDQSSQTQDQADRANFQGMPIENQKKYANLRDYYLNEHLKPQVGSIAKNTISGQGTWNEISGSGGQNDIKKEGDYYADYASKVLTSWPEITTSSISPHSVDGNGFIKEYAGLHGAKLPQYNHVIPAHDEEKTDPKTFKTIVIHVPQTVETKDNSIEGLKKVGNTVYMVTTESLDNPNKYPNGVPVKDFTADVLRPVIINNSKGGQKTWDAADEAFVKKTGKHLLAGNLGIKEGEKFLGMKKNRSKLSTQKNVPIYDQEQ